MRPTSAAQLCVAYQHRGEKKPFEIKDRVPVRTEIVSSIQVDQTTHPVYGPWPRSNASRSMPS
jgi:hypothetical protein